MLRVIRDSVARLRWTLLGMPIVLTAGWVAALRPGVSPTLVRLAYAFSFYADLFLLVQLKSGPESPLRLRLVRTLPIRRADLGAGGWLFAIIAPTLVATSAKVLAAGIVHAASIATPVDLRWLMCSGIFDLAYVGAMCWLPSQVLRVGIRAGVGRVTKTRFYRAFAMMGAVYIGSALALAEYMPTSWDQWHWHTGPVLAGLLGLTIAGRSQVSRQAAFVEGSRPPTQSAPRERTDGIITLPPRVPFNSRLSGLRRMLWIQCRSALVTSVIVMSLLVVAGAAPYSRTRGFWEQLREGISTMPTEVGAGIWVMGWFLYFTIGVSRWTPSKFPLLRILPVSLGEIRLVLFLRTVVTCGAFYLAVLPIYLLSPVATHPWMGLGWLTALIGVSGLTSAAMARWQGSPLVNFVVLGANYLMIFGRRWTHVNSSVANTAAGEFIALALGLCAIGAAFMWNRRLLMQLGRLGQANWMRSKS